MPKLEIGKTYQSKQHPGKIIVKILSKEGSLYKAKVLKDDVSEALTDDWHIHENDSGYWEPMPFLAMETIRGTAILNEDGTVLTISNSGHTLTIQWASNVSYSKRNEYYPHFNGKKVKITIEEEA